MKKMIYDLDLPLSKTQIGKWLEMHGGEISISCVNAVFCVRVGWKKLHTYSDDKGQHSEIWSLSRHDKDLPKALKDATDAAVKVSQEGK